MSMARYIITIIALTISLISNAAGKTKFFNYCVELPSEKLMDMGYKYVHDTEKPDSALVCYTVVTGRYGKDAPDNDKQMCINAYIGEWYIYFFVFFNYSKAIECLYLAENVCEETHSTRPDIYMDFGCTYQTIAEESQDTKLYRLALQHYKRAVKEAFSTGDLETLNITFTNIITTAYTLGSLDEIASEWNKYKDMDMPEYRLLAEYNRLLYRGLEHTSKGLFDKALEIFDRQIELTTNQRQLQRYLIISYINKANVYVKAGKYERAIDCLQPAVQIATDHDIKDARLDIYRTLADCYKQRGMMAKSMEYREKYFYIKDTLLNYHQLASINEARFMNDMKKMDDQLATMRHRHKIFNILIVIFSVVFVIIMCFVYILYIKNRQLNKSNKLLYKKNVEILQSEEKERALRKKYEQMQAVSTVTSEDDDIETEKDDRPKKKSPNIENMDDIYSRIQSVMESSDAIFSPDFSADALATLVGIKQRYVSQTLHEKGGTNFYSMLGKYRVKEACKRFRDDANYRNLTIEGIANSVGFKSRSNFIATFKRIVGLTPSEYQKMVKDGI